MFETFLADVTNLVGLIVAVEEIIIKTRFSCKLIEVFERLCCPIPSYFLRAAAAFFIRLRTQANSAPATVVPTKNRNT